MQLCCVASPYQFSRSTTWPHTFYPLAFTMVGLSKKKTAMLLFFGSPFILFLGLNLYPFHIEAITKSTGVVPIIMLHIYIHICLGWGSTVLTMCCNSNQVVWFRTDLLVVGVINMFYIIYIYRINIYKMCIPSVKQASLSHEACLFSKQDLDLFECFSGKGHLSRAYGTGPSGGLEVWWPHPKSALQTRYQKEPPMNSFSSLYQLMI